MVAADVDLLVLPTMDTFMESGLDWLLVWKRPTLLDGLDILVDEDSEL